MLIDEYTPCRISECFLDQDGEIEIILNTGPFRLKGVGRTIWLMLDGKHSIRSIVDQLCIVLAVSDREKLQKELIIVLSMLKNKGVIIVNWDPIYKLQLSQELEYSE